MNYGYIRVSTDKQSVENQRFEINCFCQRQQCEIDIWVEETVSGTKSPEKRKLGKVISRMHKGDVLICAELSRLGRNLLMIMSVLNLCMNKEIEVWTIKDNYRLGNDINSKVLAFAFGLSAEIERNLISERTKEALARKRAEGIVLGRPKGAKNKKNKLSGHEEQIIDLYKEKKTMTSIAQKYRVHPVTISRFLKSVPTLQSRHAK